jgi:hypothetical protein
MYTIYDAYLYKYKKFILALTYTPGYNIQYIIDDIIETFHLHPIKLEGSDMLSQNSVFNYDKLNTEVNTMLEDDKHKLKHSPKGYYGTGILIYGLNFTPSKLNFQIDLQLHFSTPISMFLKSMASTDGKIIYTVDDYNKFKDLMSDNKIHKYFNIKSEPSNEINDSVYAKIVDFFEFKVYGKDYDKFSTKSIKEKEGKKLEIMAEPDAVPAIESNKQNEILNDALENISADLALSISFDELDEIYPTKKKYTNRFNNKKIEKELKNDDYNDDNDDD